MIKEDLNREIAEVEALLREVPATASSDPMRIAEALGKLFIARRQRELSDFDKMPSE